MYIHGKKHKKLINEKGFKFSLFQVFLENGADVNKPDSSSSSPILHAVKQQDKVSCCSPILHAVKQQNQVNCCSPILHAVKQQDKVNNCSPILHAVKQQDKVNNF